MSETAAPPAGEPGTALPAPRPAGRPIIVSSLASDTHTWNLIYLQLLIEELGYEVVNLGPCVPDELLIAQCTRIDPAMIVLSSVNGHGYQDGLRVIARLRASPRLAGTPSVIGGKLGVSAAHRVEQVGRLLAAGFDAVYDDQVDAPVSFRSLVATFAAVGQ